MSDGGSAYRVELKRSAQKALAKLPRKVQVQIGEKIDALARDPRPQGVKKLSLKEEKYRVRSGDYRILYEIEDDRLIVLVLKIGDRKDVYRDL